MIVSFCTYALRRAAPAGALPSRSSWCLGTVCGGVYSTYPQQNCSSLSCFTLGRAAFSYFTSGATATGGHRRYEGIRAFPVVSHQLSKAKHAASSVVPVLASAISHSYVRQLPPLRSCGEASLFRVAYYNTTRRASQRTVVLTKGGSTKTCTGSNCDVCNSRHHSHPSVMRHYSCPDVGKVRNSNSGSFSKTSFPSYDIENRCVSCGRSSRKEWITRRACTLELEGNIISRSTYNSSICYPASGKHLRPVNADATMSGVPRDHSLPTCSSEASRSQYHLPFSVSSFSIPTASPFSTFLSPLLRTSFMPSLRQHLTRQRGAHTTAAALSIPVSNTQQPSSRVCHVEEGWPHGHHHKYVRSDAGTQSEESTLSSSHGSEEDRSISHSDFAQVRRVSSVGEQEDPTRVEDVVPSKGREKTFETKEQLTQKPATTDTPPTARKKPSSGISRSKRPRDSGRAQPPLFRVTDAAAARIREIVETYNRESALSKTSLRNGSRHQENDSNYATTQQERSSSNADSSNEAQYHQARGHRRAIGIRIGLKKRGCSGLSYTIDVATREEDAGQLAGDSSGDASAAGKVGNRRLSAATIADEIVETEGGTVVLAADAIMFLVGTELDFIDTELERKFVFKNPNEKQACGCGKSFTV